MRDKTADPSSRARNRSGAEPASAPSPPTRPAQIAGIALAHAVPIIGIFVFGWSATQFLVLSVFNLGLSIGNIGLTGVAASAVRGSGSAAPRPMRIGEWTRLFVACMFIALLLTAIGSWPIFVLADDGAQVFASRQLWLSALTMQILAAPSLYAEFVDKVHSPLSLDQIKRQDQSRVGSAFSGIAVGMILTGYAGDLGGAGLSLLVVAFTALSLFRELRPDLVFQAIQKPRSSPDRR